MKLAALFAVVAALGIVAPSVARADEGDEASTSGDDEVTPVKRYPPSSVRYKLVGGGIAVTGLAYGTALLCSSSWPDAPGADELKIPVVGPWLALGKSGCAEDDPDCGALAYVRAVLTVIDGLAQAGGVGIIGEGIFMTTEARPAKKRPAAGVVIRPVPVVTARSTGVGIVGSF